MARTKNTVRQAPKRASNQAVVPHHTLRLMVPKIHQLKEIWYRSTSFDVKVSKSKFLNVPHFCVHIFSNSSHEVVASAEVDFMGLNKIIHADVFQSKDIGTGIGIVEWSTITESKVKDAMVVVTIYEHKNQPTLIMEKNDDDTFKLTIDGNRDHLKAVASPRFSLNDDDSWQFLLHTDNTGKLLIRLDCLETKKKQTKLR